MAQYVQIPKDLNKVKDKFILGLTKRQTVCFALGLTIGGLAYYSTYKTLGTSTSGVILFILACPFILTGLYEKNGFTLDKIVLNLIRFRFLYPQIRTYETENFYSCIEQHIKYEKELKMLETGKKPVGSKKTQARK